MFFIFSAVCFGILILFVFVDFHVEILNGLSMMGAAIAFIGTVAFLIIGISTSPYVEVQRYELRDYSLTVTESHLLFSPAYSERFSGTTYDNMKFDLDLYEIRKEGETPVLVKYERKLLGISSCYYGLILPADSVGEKVG